jgi:hypothetical protein
LQRDIAHSKSCGDSPAGCHVSNLPLSEIKTSSLARDEAAAKYLTAIGTSNRLESVASALTTPSSSNYTILR